MQPLSKAERLWDYRRTGHGDCDNVFDGDDVPSADDLREAFDAHHMPLETYDAEMHVDLREAWVQGWLERASVHVERYRREEAAHLAKEED